MKFMRKKIIYGCEGRGDAESPYLTRWTIIERGWAVYLHIFHRSDADVMHDHPWPFVSVILWRGYVEVTDKGCRRKCPGMILFRPAEHTHRVELVGGRPAVSLVFRGAFVRQWGFHTERGWVHWVEYFKALGCWGKE